MSILNKTCLIHLLATIFKIVIKAKLTNRQILEESKLTTSSQSVSLISTRIPGRLNTQTTVNKRSKYNLIKSQNK